MLYDFKCDECGNVFEVNCKMSDSGLVRECPACNGILTHRFYGVDSIPTFNGDGGMTAKKVPSDFKDLLKNIKKNAIGGKNMQSSVI